MLENNRRSYKRNDSFCFDTRISLDGKTWNNAMVFDFSAGGLKFNSDVAFKMGDILWFDLAIPEFLSTYKIKIKGTICRETQEGGQIVYGVAFHDLSPELRITIDEKILLWDRLYRGR